MNHRVGDLKITVTEQFFAKHYRPVKPLLVLEKWRQKFDRWFPIIANVWG